MPTDDSRVSSQGRITSMDVVRGLVMVLMAIDHVRVYSGNPAGGPTAGIFFTRWVTHFVAPGFLFFAGTGAFLHGAKLADRGKLARFLVSRGLWLVLLELTFLRFAWTFNFDYANYSLAGVIWMIGWCMVLMGGLIYLPMWAIGTFGVVTMLLHPVLNLLGEAAKASALAPLWQILYFGGAFNFGKDGPPLLILFVIIPWIGVMAAGYAFGPVMRWTAERRRAFCLRVGFGAIALFVLLRALDVRRPARLAWDGEERIPDCARIPQHEQISGVAALFDDDARTAHCTPATRRECARMGCAKTRDVRAGTAVLLHPAYPAHSSRGGRRLARFERARSRRGCSRTIR